MKTYDLIRALHDLEPTLAAEQWLRAVERRAVEDVFEEGFYCSVECPFFSIEKEPHGERRAHCALLENTVKPVQSFHQCPGINGKIDALTGDVDKATGAQ